MRFAFLLPFLIAAVACTGPQTNTPDGGTSGGDDAGLPGDDGGVDGGMSCVPPTLPSLDNGTWDPRFAGAGFNGHDGNGPTVYDFATDKDGSLLAVGRFEYRGTERVVPFMRLTDEGWQQARTEWGGLTLPGAGFSAIAVGDGGELALSTGDDFNPREGEIWVDTGAGLQSIGHFSGLVRRMVWFKGDLWVAGDFMLDGGAGAPGLAVWDGMSWSAPPGGGPDGIVYELQIDGDSLWVGGDYHQIGGITVRSIAAWDGTKWTAYDLPFAYARVYALERGADGAMYAGGMIFDDPDLRLGGLVRYDGTGWKLFGNGVSSGFIPGTVSDLLLDDGQLYVTGCFKTVGGTQDDPDAVSAFALARWTGTKWEGLDDGTKGVGSPYVTSLSCGDEGPDKVWDMEYQRLYKHGANIYVGGAFPGVAGVPSQSIVAYDGTQFIQQGEPRLSVAGAIDDLVTGGPDCAIYAVGQISHVGGKPVPSRVAKLDPNGDWTALGGPLPEGESCENLAITDVGDLYLGCTNFGDTLAGHVFKWDGTTWNLVGQPFTDKLVMDLAVDPSGKLWVAGGADTGFIARLEGDEFVTVEDGFDGIVFALDFKPAAKDAEKLEYVAAGVFEHIGTDPYTRIARWNGTGWEALGDGLTSTVSALEYGNTGIYVATQYEGGPRFTLARWNGTAWEELATPEHGLAAPWEQTVHTFQRIQEVGEQLVATGYVWPETGERNVFLFDGQNFHAIGGGVNAIDVRALAITHDGLWFGGTIADTGSGEDRRPSIGMAHYQWSAMP
ncbi:MAG: hypothetical protein IRZ16_09470 [Myxococcaceae bacterium]|nr:hypothetical protein [Myxococcaceae bacterium]